MERQRRRIDIISEPAFVADLTHLELDELRKRRSMCGDLERELSYLRKLIHGRLDVLAYERRRRAGDEDRPIAEALPTILGDTPPSGPGGHVTASLGDVTPPDLPTPGRRRIDFVLGDDFLARLGDLDDGEIAEIEATLRTTETSLSQQRRTVHDAEAALGDELRRRYREGHASVDELLHG